MIIAATIIIILCIDVQLASPSCCAKLLADSWLSQVNVHSPPLTTFS